MDSKPPKAAAALAAQAARRVSLEVLADMTRSRDSVTAAAVAVKEPQAQAALEAQPFAAVEAEAEARELRQAGQAAPVALVLFASEQCALAYQRKISKGINNVCS